MDLDGGVTEQTLAPDQNAAQLVNTTANNPETEDGKIDEAGKGQDSGNGSGSAKEVGVLTTVEDGMDDQVKVTGPKVDIKDKTNTDSTNLETVTPTDDEVPSSVVQDQTMEMNQD